MVALADVLMACGVCRKQYGDSKSCNFNGYDMSTILDDSYNHK